MAISNAEFALWLRDPKAVRCVLLETESWFSGAASPRYASNLGYVSQGTDTPPNTPYPGRIISIPYFSVTMSEQLRGVTVPASGEIVLNNNDGGLDGYLRHAWDGRPFSLLIGDPSWARADFRQMLAGIVEDVTSTARDKISLVIRDLRKTLDKPMTSTKVASGPNINKYYPLCFGECYNITPLLINTANNTYAVHDAAVEDIVAVRQNGVDITGNVTDNGDGTFSLSAAATGAITADVKGGKINAGVYSDVTGYIMEHIVVTRCGVSSGNLHTASWNGIKAFTAKVGMYLPDGSISALEALDALALGCGGWYGFDRNGKVRVGRVNEPGGAASITITANEMYKGGLRLFKRYTPLAAINLGYKKRWTVQTSLDETVTGADRVTWSTPYDIVTKTNTIPQHLLATANPDLDGTLFITSTDAQTEADRRASLRSQIRYLFEVECATGAINAQIGETIRIEHPRYGFAAGLNAVVVGIEENPASRVTRLMVWR